MKKELIAKRIISLGALCFGATGIWLAYLCFQGVIEALTEMIPAFSLCFLIPSCAICIGIAVQNIRTPGTIAVRNLTAGTMAVVSYGTIRLLAKTPLFSAHTITVTIVMWCIPVIAIILHCLLSRRLLRAAGYEPPSFSAAHLQEVIAQQNISSPSKESLKELVPQRNSPTTPGYFLLACSWFLFALAISSCALDTPMHVEDSETVIGDKREIWFRIFWIAIFFHIAGKALLKKIALAKAVVEMLEVKNEAEA